MTDRAIRDFSRHAAGGAKFDRGTFPQHLLRSAGRTTCYQDADGNLIECAANIGDYKYYEEQERESKAEAMARGTLLEGNKSQAKQRNGRSGS